MFHYFFTCALSCQMSSGQQDCLPPLDSLVCFIIPTCQETYLKKKKKSKFATDLTASFPPKEGTSVSISLFNF